jgi:hypothetical protein
VSTPRRYQFDNHLPATREPAPAPVHRPQPLPEQQAQQGVPQVVHIHQAPPDRTLQRVALGAGMGGGAVAAGVFFLPLLIEAVHALVASLAVLALLVAVVAWAVVTIVNAVGGKTGQQAAKTLAKTRRGWLRRR